MADSAAQWFVAWTHSNSERLVHDQLAGRGFELVVGELVDQAGHFIRRPGEPVEEVGGLFGFEVFREDFDRKHKAV